MFTKKKAISLAVVALRRDGTFLPPLVGSFVLPLATPIRRENEKNQLFFNNFYIFPTRRNALGPLDALLKEGGVV